MLDWAEVVVELVNERHRRRDIEVRNHVLRSPHPLRIGMLAAAEGRRRARTAECEAVCLARRSRRQRLGYLGDVVEMLDQRTEGVSVSGDDELLARLDDWDQGVVPQRHEALHLRAVSKAGGSASRRCTASSAVVARKIHSAARMNPFASALTVPSQNKTETRRCRKVV